jgi:hypothetical protein
MGSMMPRRWFWSAHHCQPSPAQPSPPVWSTGGAPAGGWASTMAAPGQWLASTSWMRVPDAAGHCCHQWLLTSAQPQQGVKSLPEQHSLCSCPLSAHSSQQQRTMIFTHPAHSVTMPSWLQLTCRARSPSTSTSCPRGSGSSSSGATFSLSLTRAAVTGVQMMMPCLKDLPDPHQHNTSYSSGQC